MSRRAMLALGHGRVRVWAALAVTACVLLLVGCGSGERVELLRDWTLTTPIVASRPITLPAHVDDALPPGPSRYTLRTRAAIPPDMRGRTISLSIPHFAGLASLRVDGYAIAPMTRKSWETYRGRFHAWRIADELTSAPEIEIELEVNHEWTQSAWLDTVPRLSSSPDGDATFRGVRDFVEVSSVIAVVTLWVSCLTYALIYFRPRRSAAHGYFAIEALAGSVFPTFYLSLLQPLLGTWEVAAAVIGLDVSVVMSVYFVHAKFGLGKPSKLWLVALVGLTIVGAARGGPFDATRWFVPPTLALLSVNAIYHLYVLAKLRRDPPPNLYIITLSWPLVVTLGVPDMVVWLGLGDPLGGLRMGSFSVAIIAMAQAAALSREHVTSLERTDELNLELAHRVELAEGKNREVEVLNDELRRQVATRSEQLAAILSRAPAPARTLAPDEVVEGRYRIVASLGAGAAGRVYRVERVADGRPFALKVLSAEGEPTAFVRFAREAHALAQIVHPNIVRVVDVDVSDSGMLFLVMDLVEGPTLRKAHARFGDVAWALAVLRQIADGLAAVHAAGLVHRDLKPANVVLASDDLDAAPDIRIIDFGIAGLIGERASSVDSPSDPDVVTLVDAAASKPLDARESLTATGVVLGTPHYLAPELLQGARHALPAVDLFSLGVMAHELLTGKRPFGESPACAAMAGSLGLVPPSLRDTVPASVLSTEICALLDRCLSASPEARPTAAEIATAIAQSVLTSGVVGVVTAEAAQRGLGKS